MRLLQYQVQVPIHGYFPGNSKIKGIFDGSIFWQPDPMHLSDYTPMRDATFPCTKNPLPTDGTFVIDAGSYVFRFGFLNEATPRYEIRALTSRNKNRDGSVKAGTDITEVDLSKSTLRTPYMDGVFMNFECIQSLFQCGFARIFSPPAVRNLVKRLGRKDLHVFPYEVALSLPFGTPVTAKIVIIDMLLNGFRVPAVTLHISEIVCQHGLSLDSAEPPPKAQKASHSRRIVLHMGNQATSLLPLNITAKHSMEAVVNATVFRSALSSELHTYFIYRHLLSRYTVFSHLFTIDMAESIKHSIVKVLPNCTETTLTNGSPRAPVTEYDSYCTSVSAALAQIARPADTILEEDAVATDVKLARWQYEIYSLKTLFSCLAIISSAYPFQSILDNMRANEVLANRTLRVSKARNAPLEKVLQFVRSSQAIEYFRTRLERFGLTKETCAVAPDDLYLEEVVSSTSVTAPEANDDALENRPLAHADAVGEGPELIEQGIAPPLQPGRPLAHAHKNTFIKSLLLQLYDVLLYDMKSSRNAYLTYSGLKNIDNLIDILMKETGFTCDEEISSQKILNAMYETYQAIGNALDTVSIKLRMHGILSGNHTADLTMPPICYRMNGVAVDPAGNVALPLLVEPVFYGEVLFYPHIMGVDTCGLSELIGTYIGAEGLLSQTAVDTLIVYVTGGGSRVAGLQERLTNDVRALLPEHISLQVICTHAGEWERLVAIVQSDYEHAPSAHRYDAASLKAEAASLFSAAD